MAMSMPASSDVATIPPDPVPTHPTPATTWLAARGAWQRRGLAVASGLLICAGMPPWGWWPLTLLGIAGWALLLDRPTPRARFGVGAFVGVGWFVPSTMWMVKFTPAAWPIGVSVWFPFVIGAASAACPPGRWRFAGLAAVATATEWFRWHAPFGGVPLSMLAMTQARGPMLDVARIGGSIGVSLCVASVGASIGAVIDGARRTALVAGGAVVAVVVLGTIAPQGHAVGELEVAAVQGGGAQQTVSARTDYDAVLGRHLAEAAKLTGPVDLVVLPENIVNNTGFWEGSPQQREVADLARRLGATVVIGVVEDRFERRRFYNAAVAIDPDGRQVARYDKVRRVPYGEYVPLRFLLDTVAHDQLPPRDAVAGTDPPVLDTPAGKLGVAISWEIFFGRRVRDAMHSDAEIIVNPTNGSSYWLTQVQTQQLASTALRAVESGRWVVQAAPTGFSTVVSPDGEEVGRVVLGEAGTVRARVERRRGQTIASATGDLIPMSVCAALIAVAWVRVRRGSRASVATPG